MGAGRTGRGGGGGRRSRALPSSFLEVWDRRYPLREVWVRAAFVEGDAELDLFAQTEGRRPAGLCIEGLLVPGAKGLGDLVGRTVIDPPPGLLSIGSLHDRGREAAAGPGGASAVAGGAPPAERAGGGASKPAPAAGAESEGALLGDDVSEEDALDRTEPRSERSAYIPGEQFAVERLRLELGERRGDRIDVLLHLEAVSFGEDGEVTDLDVPLVGVLRAKLEAV